MQIQYFIWDFNSFFDILTTTNSWPNLQKGYRNQLEIKVFQLNLFRKLALTFSLSQSFRFKPSFKLTNKFRIHFGQIGQAWVCAIKIS